MKKIIVVVFFGALIYLGRMGFLKLPFTRARPLLSSKSLVLAALATCGAKRFFLIYRSTSREIRRSFLNTCQAEGAERQLITFTESLVPTV